MQPHILVPRFSPGNPLPCRLPLAVHRLAMQEPLMYCVTKQELGHEGMFNPCAEG